MGVHEFIRSKDNSRTTVQANLQYTLLLKFIDLNRYNKLVKGAFL